MVLACIIYVAVPVGDVCLVSIPFYPLGSPSSSSLVMSVLSFSFDADWCPQIRRLCPHVGVRRFGKLHLSESLSCHLSE